AAFRSNVKLDRLCESGGLGDPPAIRFSSVMVPVIWRLPRFCSAVAISYVLFAAMPAHGFIIAPNDPDPWLSTASGSRSGNGAPATITWSIVPDGTSVTHNDNTLLHSPSNLISFLNTNFGTNSAAQGNLALQPWFHIFQD